MHGSWSRSAGRAAGGVGAEGAEEVDLAERGPVGVAEIELGVGALPEQEVRHPLFAAGPDDQIWVGLPGGVEVVADVGGSELGGQAVEIVAGRGFRLEE